VVFLLLHHHHRNNQKMNFARQATQVVHILRKTFWLVGWWLVGSLKKLVVLW
jgi:hypothetical protein